MAIVKPYFSLRKGKIKLVKSHVRRPPRPKRQKSETLIKKMLKEWNKQL